MRLTATILQVERTTEGFLVQVAGPGVRGAVMLDVTPEVPQTGQTFSFEYGASVSTTSGDALRSRIPLATAVASSGTGSTDATRTTTGNVTTSTNAAGTTSGATPNDSSSAESEFLQLMMGGARNTPLAGHDVEAELDAFVGTPDEVRRGLILMRAQRR